jgi:hypothetical protein
MSGLPGLVDMPASLRSRQGPASHDRSSGAQPQFDYDFRHSLLEANRHLSLKFSLIDGVGSPFRSKLQSCFLTNSSLFELLPPQIIAPLLFFLLSDRSLVNR